ncbi:cytochrome P450 7A1 [Protopterus annectens]|uniref:cytochrome P450 7A1 n=1 Tax=Protopterus annectens TaxID=7888 RepID=UPI001CFBACE0|nr:cytochrome P450 7A1 [Protopterus annectens]
MTGPFFWIVTLLIGVVVLWFLAGRRRRCKGEPPLENGWIPFFGVGIEFGRDPLKFLLSRKKIYGDIFTCKMVGKYVTFITCPFTYSALFRHGKELDFQVFAKETSAKAFGQVDYNDPRYDVTTEELHRTLKDLQGTSLDTLASSNMHNFQLVMSRIKPPLDTCWCTDGLQSFLFRILFEVGFLTIFGRNKMAVEKSEGFDTEIRIMQSIFEDFMQFDSKFPLIVAGFPINIFRAAKRAREQLLQKLLHTDLKQNTGISSLIKERMSILDTSPTLTEMNKASTHLVMLWALQANTLPMAFWTFFYLLRTPEALNAAKCEVERVLSATNQKVTNVNHSINLTKDQLDSMTTLGSIISEVLRLTAASSVIRCVMNDFVLELDSGQDLSIRKGDWIILHPRVIHLDPDIYEDPMEFKYNRFLDDNQKEKTDFYKNGRKLKHYLMPFGAGVSMCPGRFFAINEIKQSMCMLLLKYDMELVDLTEPVPPVDNSRAGLGVLMPKYDVQFRYRLKLHSSD